MIELTAGPARIELLPEIGGRIHQLWLQVEGREEGLLATHDDPTDHAREPLTGGCYPMAPWPNRVAGGVFSWAGRTVSLPVNDPPNALHGLLFDRPWEVVARAGRVVELRCDLGPGWPWDGYAWQRIQLSESGLFIKAEVRSRRESFPAGIGLHPWFRRQVGDSVDAFVRLVANSRYVMDRQIPTGQTVPPSGMCDLATAVPLGTRELDDCYTGVSGSAEIDWGPVSLTIAMECREPHVMVHTTPRAFCIEPQTCAPDCFNLRAKVSGTGFQVAEPGRSVALVSRWSWRIM